MSLEGTVGLNEGGTSTITTPFQVTNCAALKFEPKFSVSTSAKTSRTDGASLSAKLTYPSVPQGTEADIAKVKVELPGQLPSRLTTLQKACTATQFEANPAGLPRGVEDRLRDRAYPVDPSPVAGPSGFSSATAAKRSRTLNTGTAGLRLSRSISSAPPSIKKNGVTSTTFKTVPDQPFSSFELTLPEGPYSALTTTGSLCSLTKTVTVKKKVTVRVHGRRKTITRSVKQAAPATLAMPTEFVAQNGAEIHQDTPITVTGCPLTPPASKTKAKPKKTRNRKHGKR